MDTNKMVQQGAYGRLPANAPLANPYVPFQMEDPPKYELRAAIVRGTLFPGLDLPFMNMVNTKELPITPMTELQTMGFALQELALYLDTHKDDREALELYLSYVELAREGKKRYEKAYGPLTQSAVTDAGWTWLKDPWPWDLEGGRK